MPRWPETLFFMHIGKTAGCYLNQCFVETFGVDHVLQFCQDVIGPTNETDYPELFTDKAVISGHLFLADWTEFSRKRGIVAKRVTILRSPLHQMVSTMRFLDGFNAPAKHEATSTMLGETHEVVLRLADVNFDDAASIDAFLATLTPLGVQLFDNPQSRYFLCRAQGFESGRVSRPDPLTLDSNARLSDAFEKFDLVGLTERLPETLGLLSDLIGRPVQPSSTRVNETISPRTINLGNEEIRQAIGRRVTLDTWLYRHAVEQFDRKVAGANERSSIAA